MGQLTQLPFQGGSLLYPPCMPFPTLSPKGVKGKVLPWPFTPLAQWVTEQASLVTQRHLPLLCSSKVQLFLISHEEAGDRVRSRCAPEGVPAAVTLCLMTGLHLERNGDRNGAGPDLAGKQWELGFASKPFTGLVGMAGPLHIDCCETYSDVALHFKCVRNHMMETHNVIADSDYEGG